MLPDLRAGVVIELPFSRRVAHQNQILNRLIIRVGFRKRRRARQIDRKLCGCPRDRRLNVGRRSVEALRKTKLQHEARVTLSIVRGHHLESGDLHELAFQRRGHVVGHRLRSRARITNLHLNHRVIHGRQVAHRKPEISKYAKQNDRGGQRHGHNWAPDEEFGNVQDALLRCSNLIYQPPSVPAPSRVRSSRHALCFPAEPTTVPPALRVPRPLARSRSPHRCLDADPK